MAAAFDWLLAGIILLLAVASVAARGRLPAVVLYVSYGVLVGIAWVRLGAVDVALAEAAIGAGLTGVLLLGAVGCTAERQSLPLRLVPPLLAAGSSAALMIAVADISANPGEGLGARALAQLDRAGAENPVTAVLLSFRGWDTFLETVVLGIALVAVWALSADQAWGGRPSVRQRVRPDGVLATFGRFLPPLGLLVGIYLVWTGASAPGGAFQGGTVLAAVWLMALMAALAEPPASGGLLLRGSLVIGPALFLLAGILGFAFGAFLGWPPGFEKPTVLVIEFALTLSIAVTLAMLVLGAPRRSA
ncbi:MAG: hydrogenase subunit MbhD domain-containing protein [Thermaurantiacus sp.]